MIDQSFYGHLEMKISYALEHSSNPEWRKYWCDGIIIPDASNLLSKPSSDQVECIVTTAIIPKGQYTDDKYRYQLTIWLGKMSHERIRNHEPLDDCAPASSADEWINLDTDNQRIDIELL